jgi:SHS2 domain-containing protein
LTHQNTSASDRSRPEWLTELDHTGDAGLEVSATGMGELFERAAWGMFAILTDMEDVSPDESIDVTAEAADRDALLVQWLSELNYLHVTDAWLFSAFEIVGVSEKSVSGVAFGERYDPERHTLYTEIKAVTFHDLVIERTGDAWRARVVFDM